MKRFHLHLRVFDLDSNIRFFSSLFGVAPTSRDGNCARWVLEDPHLVFSVSSDGLSPGLKLVGIHADTAQELDTVRQRFASADANAFGEPVPLEEDAEADTHWLIDPQGVLWEARRIPRE